MRDEDILNQWEMLSGKKTNEFRGNQHASSKQVFDAHTFCASFMKRHYGRGLATLDFSKVEDRELALDCYRFFDEQRIKELAPEKLAKFIATYHYIERPSIYKEAVNSSFDALGNLGFQALGEIADRFMPELSFFVPMAQSGIEKLKDYIPDVAEKKSITAHQSLINSISTHPALSVFQKLVQLETLKARFMGMEGALDPLKIQSLYEQEIQKLSSQGKTLNEDLQNLRSKKQSEQEILKQINDLIVKQTQTMESGSHSAFFENKEIAEKIKNEQDYKNQLNLAKRIVSHHIPYAEIATSIEVCTGGASLLMHVVGKHSIGNKISVIGSNVVTICRSIEAIQTTSLLASAGSSLFTAFAAGGPYVAIASAAYSIFSALSGSGNNDGMQKALQSISNQIVNLEKHLMKRIHLLEKNMMQRFDTLQFMMESLHRRMDAGFKAILSNQQTIQEQLGQLSEKIVEFRNQMLFWKGLSEVSFYCINSKIDETCSKLSTLLQKSEHARLIENLFKIHSKIKTYPLTESEFKNCFLDLCMILVEGAKNPLITEGENAKISGEITSIHPAFSINALARRTSTKPELVNPEIWRSAVGVLLQLFHHSSSGLQKTGFTSEERNRIGEVIQSGTRTYQFVEEIGRSKFVSEVMGHYINLLKRFNSELKKRKADFVIKVDETERKEDLARIREITLKIQAEPMPNFGNIVYLPRYPHGESRKVKDKWLEQKDDNKKIEHKQKKWIKKQEEKIKELTKEAEKRGSYKINPFVKLKPKPLRVKARQKVNADMLSQILALDNSPLSAMLNEIDQQFNFLTGCLALAFQPNEGFALQSLFKKELLKTKQEILAYLNKYQGNEKSVDYLDNRIDATIQALEVSMADLSSIIDKGKLKNRYGEIQELIKLLQTITINKLEAASSRSVPFSPLFDSSLKSSSEGINIHYRYSDQDINDYVEKRIRTNFGGYKAGNRYLLAGRNGSETYPGLREGCYVAITSAVGINTPIEHVLDKSTQPTPERRDDRRDIFDEIVPLFRRHENVNVKILFPFHEGGLSNEHGHWNLGEIIIAKRGIYFNVLMYLRDPFGKGQLSREMAANIERIIADQLSNRHRLPAIVNCEARPCNFERRQAVGDAWSCGAIVAEDLLRRINDEPLNRSYPLGAENLRREQREFMKRSDSGNRAHRANRSEKMNKEDDEIKVAKEKSSSQKPVSSGLTWSFNNISGFPSVRIRTAPSEGFNQEEVQEPNRKRIRIELNNGMGAMEIDLIGSNLEGEISPDGDIIMKPAKTP